MGLAGTVKTKVNNGRLFQQPWYYAIGEERVSLHGYCTLTLKINVSLSCHVRKEIFYDLSLLKYRCIVPDSQSIIYDTDITASSLLF